MSVAELQDPLAGGIHAIPELAPQWRKLDLRPDSQAYRGLCLDQPDQFGLRRVGRPRARKPPGQGSLEATIRVVEAARKASNFVLFNWVGYSVFREDYAKSIFDEVQYAQWVEGKDVHAGAKAARRRARA